MNFFKFGKNKAAENDTRTEDQKQALENAKKLSAQQEAMLIYAIRKGGTGYLRNQPKQKKAEKVKKERTVGKFANVKSRKERRAEVTKDTKFVPIYNGEAPFRGQNKDVFKIQKNAEKYKEKQKLRKAQ